MNQLGTVTKSQISLFACAVEAVPLACGAGVGEESKTSRNRQLLHALKHILV